MKPKLRVTRRIKLKLLGYSLIILPVLSLCPFSSTFAQSSHSYTIATATPGGTFYRVGYAIAALVTEDLGIKVEKTVNNKTEENKTKKSTAPSIFMTAMNTDGSIVNIQLLHDKQVQFALVQGFIGARVASGKEDGFDAKKIKNNLRAVTPVWLNVEHFVVRRDALSKVTDSGAIDDLNYLKAPKPKKGEEAIKKPRFSIGRDGSGTRKSGLYILESIGIANPEKKFEFKQLSYSESAEALINGEIEGMNTPAGVPVAAVEKVFTNPDIDVLVLKFNKNHLGMINEPLKNNIWGAHTIVSGTYTKNQNEPIETIAQPNFLAVHKDVDEYDVCRITEIIFNNQTFFTNVHASTEIMFQRDRLEREIKKLPFDPHIGAARYFKNVGKKEKPCGDPPET